MYKKIIRKELHKLWEEYEVLNTDEPSRDPDYSSKMDALEAKIEILNSVLEKANLKKSNKKGENKHGN